MNLQIQNLIPFRLKKQVWWLLKSPQRKLGFWYSFKIDVSGYLILFRNYFRKPKIQHVSVCVGIKNRTENLTKALLTSLQNIDNQDKIEISIADCNSKDVLNLKEQIRTFWKGELVFISEDIPFSRSAIFDWAIQKSTYPIVFICDADIYLPKNFVKLANRYITEKTTWFPIVQDVDNLDNKDKSPKYRTQGYGIVGITRKNYLKIGGLDKRFKTWGLEDIDFYFKCYLHKIKPFRENKSKLLHLKHLKSLKNNSKSKD